MAEGRRRILFYSNLFPDTDSPTRGIHNGRVLGHLSEHVDLRVISPRPCLPWKRKHFNSVDEYQDWSPIYPSHYYIPRIGSRWNHLLQSSGVCHEFDHVIAEFKPDAVIGAWLYPDGCALAHLIQRYQVPFALIAQGSDVHQYLRNPARRRAIQDACQGSTKIITRSKDLQARLEEIGVASQKITTIYNGVDTELYKPTEDRGPDQPFRFLYVGNLYAIKNPIGLIEAFERVSKGLGKPATLTLIGDGPLRNEVQTEIKQRRLGASVQCLGSLPPKSVAEEMRKADCLVVPSLNEGVPNVILEAFASGLPVVATAVGGIPEILSAEEHGILVRGTRSEALATAMESAMSSNFDRKGIRQNALGFSWQRNTEAYLEIIEEMIASGR